MHEHLYLIYQLRLHCGPHDRSPGMDVEFVAREDRFKLSRKMSRLPCTAFIDPEEKETPSVNDPNSLIWKQSLTGRQICINVIT